MLTCSHLTVTLPDGRVLIDDLSFPIDAGTKLGVIAEEGDGKSTLLKILAGESTDYVRITGSFSCSAKTARLSAQIPASWMHATPLEYLLCASPQDGLENADWNQLTELCAIAAQNGINPALIDRSQPLHSLSGGERLRLAMLKVLACEPELLLLDEPTSDLDLEGLEWMEQLITNRTGPVVFISHDPTLLSRCASAILHLEARNRRSKPVAAYYPGKYENYLKVRSCSRARTAMLAAGQKRELAARRQRLNDLHNKVEGRLRTVSRQQPQAAKNLKDKMRAVKSRQASLEREERIETDSAEEEISFALPSSAIHPDKVVLDWNRQELAVGDRQLLAPFSLKITAGQRIWIQGPNGSGKSVLLKKIAKEILSRPDLKVGWMPQNYMESIDPSQSALDFLAADHPDLSHCATRLGCLHFTRAEMEQPACTLSDGQKAKLFLGRF